MATTKTKTKFKSAKVKCELSNMFTQLWWKSLPQYDRQQILVIYANKYKCPMKEINPDMTGPKDLVFLRVCFYRTIRLFIKDLQTGRD